MAINTLMRPTTKTTMMRCPAPHLLLVLAGLLLLSGCPSAPQGGGDGGKPGDPPKNGPKLMSLVFPDPVTITATGDPIALGSARNETVSFAVQVNNLPRADEKVAPVLRMQPLKLIGSDDVIDASQYAAYQLLFMPVDLNRAAFVRHTGIEEASTRALPRALIPLPADDHGQVNLAALRNPDQPRNPSARATSGSARPVLLWFDLTVPAAAKPGDYQTTFEVLERNAVVSTLVVTLHVNDFVLPTERNLQMVGQLEWSALRRLYPAIFQTARPSLMKRGDPQVAQAVAILDGLVKLGQQHRAQVVIPELKPVVKWPAGAPPQVTWDDFDSIVMPWLTGQAFPDGIPLGYWPLPEAAALRNFNLAARAQYWSAAAAHFAEKNLLNHSPIILQKESADPRITPADALRLSSEAAQLLTVNPNVRVNVPLEDEQVQFNNNGNAGLLDPATANRLMTAAHGLVYREPAGNWPKGVAEPGRWLAADKPGLVPFAGAGGDERDVRLWASLASLTKSQVVQWPNTLPNYDNPDQPADPNDVIWFYPGEWFGLDQPVPTVHLKWIRRAQQDYEYLYLTAQRGESGRSRPISRALTKPVQIPIVQNADPAYALLCGVSDFKAWQEAKQLLAESILLRPPGVEKDENKEIDLNGRTLQWLVPQERPLLMARTTTWGWSANELKGQSVDLRLGLDIYNASDQRLIGQMQWSTAEGAWPEGWHMNPHPLVITPADAVNTFHVRRMEMDVAISLDALTGPSGTPLEMSFTDELTGRTSPLHVTVPVAICDHRGNGPLSINGDLSDWSQADALKDGKLVRMLNGPAVQGQEIQLASTDSKVYSGWGNDAFYVAFSVHGCQSNPPAAETNFVDYPLGRAWGEDLSEVLLQPVYADGTAGPVLHLVAKPRGGLVVERKSDPRPGVQAWGPVAGQAIMYGATLDTTANPADPTWRGEIAIPWDAINDPKHTGAHPTLLRFNFAQHKNATGESSSWAGPIDSGRDDNFTGLLYLRDPANPGRKPE